MQISSTLYTIGNCKSGYLKGLKCALAHMGICSDFMAQPLQKFEGQEKERVRQVLEELDYKALL